MHAKQALKDFFVQRAILVSAGATYEHIDPVRFIGNHSSGKMGLALANACAELGAKVYLLKGHTERGLTIHPAIEVFHTPTAISMYKCAKVLFPKVDIGIMVAAVADYMPAKYSEHKLKKKEDELLLRLLKTPDILHYLGSVKQKHQYLVGFALETKEVVKSAFEKLQRKNADMIVANELDTHTNTIFGSDKNKVTLVYPDASFQPFPFIRKSLLAKKILRSIYLSLM